MAVLDRVHFSDERSPLKEPLEKPGEEERSVVAEIPLTPGQSVHELKNHEA
jgi:hypothetical protein